MRTGCLLSASSANTCASKIAFVVIHHQRLRRRCRTVRSPSPQAKQLFMDSSILYCEISIADTRIGRLIACMLFENAVIPNPNGPSSIPAPCVIILAGVAGVVQVSVDRVSGPCIMVGFAHVPRPPRTPGCPPRLVAHLVQRHRRHLNRLPLRLFVVQQVAQALSGAIHVGRPPPARAVR